MIIYIYALRETGQQAVKYVGQTNNLDSRLKQHLHTAKRRGVNPRDIWIADVLSRNNSVEIELIEECDIDTVAERENYWIEHYRAKGHPLTNSLPSYDNMRLRRRAKIAREKPKAARVFDEDKHRRMVQNFFDTYGEWP